MIDAQDANEIHSSVRLRIAVAEVAHCVVEMSCVVPCAGKQGGFSLCRIRQGGQVAGVLEECGKGDELGLGQTGEVCRGREYVGRQCGGGWG